MVVARIVQGVDVAVWPADAGGQIVGVDLVVGAVGHPDDGAVRPQAVGVAVPGAGQRGDVLAGVGRHGGQVVGEQAAGIGDPHGGAVRPDRARVAVAGGQFLEVGDNGPAEGIGRGPVDGDGVGHAVPAVRGLHADGDGVGAFGQADLVARGLGVGVGGADSHGRVGVGAGRSDGGRGDGVGDVGGVVGGGAGEGAGVDAGERQGAQRGVAAQGGEGGPGDDRGVGPGGGRRWRR